jgi:hypothetical protein
MKMEQVSGFADKAELIKWWDALDELTGDWAIADATRALQLARECRHPDAQWFSSLFPPGAGTMEGVKMAMVEQGDDPRALYIAWKLCNSGSLSSLQRAAHMGYAPAQALMCERESDETVAFQWAMKACSQGDRSGMFEVARRLLCGQGCEQDKDKWLELCREAALLGHPLAQLQYTRWAFDPCDWEWFFWRGLAASRGLRVRMFCDEVVDHCASFEKGKHLRILHTAAPVIRAHLDVANCAMLGTVFSGDDMKELVRVLELHSQLIGRVRAAMLCWSMVGRRYGVVKDVRLMVAKMAADQPWIWGDNREEREEGAGEA